MPSTTTPSEFDQKPILKDQPTPASIAAPAKDGQKPKEAPKEPAKSVSFSKDTAAKAPAAEKAAPETPPMDDTPKPAPKPKDPLMDLPPSKMVMDSWKRLYSNTPAAQFNEVCLKGLWHGADIPNSPTNEVGLAPAPAPSTRGIP